MGQRRWGGGLAAKGTQLGEGGAEGFTGKIFRILRILGSPIKIMDQAGVILFPERRQSAPVAFPGAKYVGKVHIMVERPDGTVVLPGTGGSDRRGVHT